MSQNYQHRTFRYNVESDYWQCLPRLSEDHEKKCNLTQTPGTPFIYAFFEKEGSFSRLDSSCLENSVDYEKKKDLSNRQAKVQWERITVSTS